MLLSKSGLCDEKCNTFTFSTMTLHGRIVRYHKCDSNTSAKNNVAEAVSSHVHIMTHGWHIISLPYIVIVL